MYIPSLKLLITTGKTTRQQLRNQHVTQCCRLCANASIFRLILFKKTETVIAAGTHVSNATATIYCCSIVIKSVFVTISVIRTSEWPTLFYPGGACDRDVEWRLQNIEWEIWDSYNYKIEMQLCKYVRGVPWLEANVIGRISAILCKNKSNSLLLAVSEILSNKQNCKITRSRKEAIVFRKFCPG